MPALASTVALTFGAGVLSFLSPCVLPLVPVYLGLLAGGAVDPRAAGRARLLTNAAAFVGGFTVVFLVLWLSFALIGYAAADVIYALRPVAGLALVIVGLHLAGLLPVAMLYRELRPEIGLPKRSGVVRSASMGMLFAAAWTPCVGPVLAAAIVLASAQDSLTRGTVLLFAYAAGLGLPFMLSALAIDRPLRLLRWARRRAQLVQGMAGALVVATGLLVLSGTLGRLAGLSWFGWSLPGVTG